MDAMLQNPYHGEQSFKELIDKKKSLVVFLRHPG